MQIVLVWETIFLKFGRQVSHLSITALLHEAQFCVLHEAQPIPSAGPWPKGHEQVELSAESWADPKHFKQVESSEFPHI